ncbi:MAG TPA: metallopeptidase TldD-related protein, partial [Nitrospiria bacterium]|nr:metallopeptidase TldD-related protein [Nitrospiria bacterium]
NTNGIAGRYPIGSVSFSMTPIATENGSMQRDFWYAVGRKLKNLETPEAVGRKAAQRTLRRLGARKIPTCEVPIIFDPETASELLGSISACVSGTAIYKGASFLAGELGKNVAAAGLSVIDDGRKQGGLGSRPFDGEGLPTRKTEVIRNGVLESYLLDSYSGRKLGMPSTGNAARSVSDVPGVSPTNLYVVGGDASPDEIIRSVDRGLYVVELIGFGVNHVTGDYSRGAVGLWIENGELSHPIEEVTIAGNLKDILMNIEMVGNDLEFRGNLASPTLKISNMIVAGS